MLGAALLLFPLMGREFLPPFNEGTLNINANLPPGTSLKESNRVGHMIEKTLHEVPEIVSTTRRTGRAELDEHAAGVNTSEIEVVTKANEIRDAMGTVPGIVDLLVEPQVGVSQREMAPAED